MRAGDAVDHPTTGGFFGSVVSPVGIDLGEEFLLVGGEWRVVEVRLRAWVADFVEDTSA